MGAFLILHHPFASGDANETPMFETLLFLQFLLKNHENSRYNTKMSF